jgi:hypothetical protein
MIRHFGVLIPATITTVEMEYNRLLPPTLQVHVGRLGKDDTTPFAPAGLTILRTRPGCSARRRWKSCV